ncbi:hypothetical protein QWY93_00575 [Echinicola jeungdonensis]|uniref:DUF2116 family Zn-ribbon domain-containing protein n=1 Tax=Echinicola jeungdonensis TaxID=709343 RepID=A0ABV5J0W1_9BACT|nr:hypothetical protein [Echinicola jeungdonensis]MDN3667835.1 hypothetical protein [Echinicola jeungdonensis]
MTVNDRACCFCGKTIYGRADKKFCDDYCRNNYNNQLKAVQNNLIRNINNSLKKNRNVLAGLMVESEETTKTTREKLLQEGFQFKYCTHHYTNKKGNIYVYCYDYGYLALDNDWYLLVRSKEN